MTDKNFKLPKAMKRLITSLGKKHSEFKKLIIDGENAYQNFKNKKTRRTE